ncbi:MAG: glycosyltransferase family 2 protein [Bacteroidetes bacterium QS_8_64_10]|nr:MAG: glycosyltransferase family 2 protein [Bacteroidetes bacterium QS_8_64_10]
MSESATRPRVSIIIVTWNALPLLQQCLPSVVATNYPNLEIILADNASSDGTVNWVREHFPSVKIVQHPENWKFCRGNNEAIAHASGEYVMLLNNDVEVPPGWMDPLVETLEDDAGVAAVQPKLLQHQDRDRFEYAGGAGGHLDLLGYPFTRGRIFFELEKDAGQYDDAQDVFWATGAALLLRRSALDEVGLLDERFVMHMEEIDLCWRLQRSGWRVRAEPASEVYHIGGASLPQHDPQKAYHNFRNSLLTFYKNLPPRWWRVLFPLRVALDAAALARAAFGGHPGEAHAIARAYRDAHRMRRHYRAQRPGPNEPTVLPSYRGRVVFDHFVRGRQRFSELSTWLFR